MSPEMSYDWMQEINQAPIPENPDFDEVAGAVKAKEDTDVSESESQKSQEIEAQKLKLEKAHAERQQIRLDIENAKMAFDAATVQLMELTEDISQAEDYLLEVQKIKQREQLQQATEQLLEVQDHLNSKLDDINSEIQGILAKSIEIRSQASARVEQLTLETNTELDNVQRAKTIADLDAKLRRFEENEDDLLDDQADLLEEQALMRADESMLISTIPDDEAEVLKLESEIQNSPYPVKDAEAKLEAVKNTIAQKRKKLAEIEPRMQKTNAELATIRADLAAIQVSRAKDQAKYDQLVAAEKTRIDALAESLYKPLVDAEKKRLLDSLSQGFENAGIDFGDAVIVDGQDNLTSVDQPNNVDADLDLDEADDTLDGQPETPVVETPTETDFDEETDVPELITTEPVQSDLDKIKTMRLVSPDGVNSVDFADFDKMVGNSPIEKIRLAVNPLFDSIQNNPTLTDEQKITQIQELADRLEFQLPDGFKGGDFGGSKDRLAALQRRVDGRLAAVNAMRPQDIPFGPGLTEQMKQSMDRQNEAEKSAAFASAANVAEVRAIVNDIFSTGDSPAAVSEFLSAGLATIMEQNAAVGKELRTLLDILGRSSLDTFAKNDALDKLGRLLRRNRRLIPEASLPESVPRLMTDAELAAEFANQSQQNRTPGLAGRLWNRIGWPRIQRGLEARRQRRELGEPSVDDLSRGDEVESRPDDLQRAEAIRRTGLEMRAFIDRHRGKDNRTMPTEARDQLTRLYQQLLDQVLEAKTEGDGWDIANQQDINIPTFMLGILRDRQFVARDLIEDPSILTDAIKGAEPVLQKASGYRELNIRAGQVANQARL